MQNWGWCCDTAGACMIHTFRNLLANLETPISMIDSYVYRKEINWNLGLHFTVHKFIILVLYVYNVQILSED